MSVTTKSLNKVFDIFWSDDDYIIGLVKLPIEDRGDQDVFEIMFAASFHPVERDLLPTQDIMHFYRTTPKEGHDESEALYTVMTVPSTNEWGNRMLYIFSLQTYSDTEGALF